MTDSNQVPVDRQMQGPGSPIRYFKDPEGERLQDELTKTLAQRAKVGRKWISPADYHPMRPKKT